MRIGTSKTTEIIDKACVEEMSIPLIVMMENSVLKAFNHMDIDRYNRYVVVCGIGNNGGDGLGIARHLIIENKEVDVFIIGNINKLSECSQINYNILKNMGIKINLISNDNDKNINLLKEKIYTSQVVVDAMFGTGLKREVSGIHKDVINIINETSKITYSIDVPSGMNCDNGDILGIAIKCKKVICFEFYKRGFLNYETQNYIDEIIVESIGVPRQLLRKYGTGEYITNESYVKNNIKIKNRYSFKSDYGKVSIIAGSEGFYGASFIATEAAVKAGSGLVTLISDKDVLDNVSQRLTEAMTCDFENKNKALSLIKSSNAICVGCGLGNSESTFNKLKYVVENSSCPVIIDADGLNVLENRCEEILGLNKDIIITPHLGEMSRLTKLSISYIRKNRIDVAKSFAKKYNITVLLKGYQTVITNGEKAYINPTGNSKMANGGMGDCLSGIITSLVGQGINSLEATVCAAYIHGYIGDKLYKDLHTINASDIIENLQRYITVFES